MGEGVGLRTGAGFVQNERLLSAVWLRPRSVVWKRATSPTRSPLLFSVFWPLKVSAAEPSEAWIYRVKVTHGLFLSKGQNSPNQNTYFPFAVFPCFLYMWGVWTSLKWGKRTPVMSNTHSSSGTTLSTPFFQRAYTKYSFFFFLHPVWDCNKRTASRKKWARILSWDTRTSNVYF